MAVYKLLQERAYHYMKDAIVSGQLKEDIFYCEAEFSEKLGTSRTPIKSALARLSEEGLVDIYPSRGFKLHMLTKEDALAISQMRSAMETYCALHVLKSRETLVGREKKRILGDMQAAMKRYSETNDVDGFLEVDIAWHKEIVSFLGNRDFLDYFERYEYWMKVLAKRGLLEMGRMAEVWEEHEDIMRAIKTDDQRLCYGAVIRHITNAYAPVLKIGKMEKPELMP